MRVVVDARLRSGQSGGVESVVAGLVSALSNLTDAEDEYLVLAHEGEEDWLTGHVHGPARLLLQPGRDVYSPARRRAARALPGLAKAWRAVRRERFERSGPPPSDGTIERAGADVMHFTFQLGFITSVPSIYHPHDLQHVHLREFFSEGTRQWRERWYRTLCRQAAMVAVASSWTKGDVERVYDLPPEKVRVVPFAPPTAAYATPASDAISTARERLRLPDEFVLYPAQTWPHKNHVGLLRALATLRRRRDLVVPLVACGAQNEGFPAIRDEESSLGISDQVVWTGFVSPSDLQALYSLAKAVVIPSKFEAASAPLWEAFAAGVPAACSNVTSLPDQAGDAAIVFDPDNVDEMADALARLWTDADLRQTLIARGSARVGEFTWEKTARLFRAHYRRLAEILLSEEDQALIQAPPRI